MNTVISDQSRPVIPVLPTPLGLVLGGVGLALAELGFAMAYWAIQQVPLIRIPQSIASWVLGNHAFAGGRTSALLGTALYALLMVGVVLVYRLASQRHRLLLRRPLACGTVYGVTIVSVGVPDHGSAFHRGHGPTDIAGLAAGLRSGLHRADRHSLREVGAMGRWQVPIAIRLAPVDPAGTGLLSSHCLAFTAPSFTSRQ